MNFTKWVSFATLIVALYILWQIRQLLLLLLTAIVLGIGLNIFVKRLTSWGIKRNYAFLIVILFLLSTLVIFVWLIVPSLFFQGQELIKLVPQGLEKLSVEIDLLKSSLSPELAKFLPDLNQILQQLQPLFNELLTRGFSFISGFLGTLLSSLLLLALTLMLSIEPEPYRQGLIRIFPYFYRGRVREILKICENDLQEWLNDIFWKIAIVTVCSFFGLLILGIPLVLAQAILAGISAFIPYIGPTISVIIPMAIAFLNSTWKPWLVLIFYILTYHIAENILIPKIRKNKVSIIPVAVVLGEIFFASFLGFLGLFLAVPLILVTQILLKEILIKDILDPWGANG